MGLTCDDGEELSNLECEFRWLLGLWAPTSRQRVGHKVRWRNESVLLLAQRHLFLAMAMAMMIDEILLNHLLNEAFSFAF